jgi:hypothetical protein
MGNSKKAYSILLLAGFFFSVSFRQSDLVFIKSIPVKAEKVATDNLSNVYLINDDVLQKYDSQGNMLKTYSNKSFGRINTIDASNPLKIILFYRNFLQVVFLDNTLAQNGDPVSVESLGYPQALFVCSSHDSGMWIYDQQNFELIRFDQYLQLSNQTGNLAQILGMDLKPQSLIEFDNRLYLNNPSEGILVFDVFGTYYKTIPIKGIRDFQFKEDALIYYQDGRMNSFNLKTLEQSWSLLPDSSAISVRISNDKLFSLSKEALGIYSVIQPVK